jgi:hypothetical protein
MTNPNFMESKEGEIGNLVKENLQIGTSIHTLVEIIRELAKPVTTKEKPTQHLNQPKEAAS